MDIKTVKKALDYKKAHLNLIQWALNQDCLINVGCRYEEEYNLKNSKNYEDIKKFFSEYDSDFVLNFVKDNNLKGWALVTPYNDDEDSVSDYSCNKFMDTWAKQFQELTERLNNE
jgi:hypothetical protein